MQRICALLLVALSGCFFPETSLANDVGGVLVFGDSLSDTGNVSALTGGAIPPSPPYFDGRFTNGLNWVEETSQALGLSLPQARLGPSTGTNYAFGGSETGGTANQATLNVVNTLGVTINDPNAGGPPPTLSDQVGLFLIDQGTSPTPLNLSKQLVMMWSGSNDILIGNKTDMQDPVDTIAGNILALIANGAKTFLVPNLPNVDSTPGVADPTNHPSFFVSAAAAAGAPLNPRVTDFNTRLETALAGIEALHPGVVIVRLDVQALLDNVIANPAGFGLTNVTVPALNEAALFGAGQVVFNDNPASSLFWDGVHPTAAAHSILGANAVAALQGQIVIVPLPAGLWMGVSLLGGLGLVRKLQKHRLVRPLD